MVDVLLSSLTPNTEFLPDLPLSFSLSHTHSLSLCAVICCRAAQGALQLPTCLSAPAPSVQGERAMMTGREKKAEGKGRATSETERGEGGKPVELISFDASNLRINEGATLHIEICRASLSRRSWEAISVAPGRGTVSCKLQLPLAHATVYNGIDGLPHKFVICQA